MSKDPTRFTRRSVAIGGGITVALGLAAVGINAPHWFRAKTAYDDLLDKLIDRDAAETVGHAIIRTASFDTKQVAADLRQRIGTRTLADVAREDLVGNRLIEAKGWVLPETLGMLCVVAAQPA
ncbi:MAG: hypothetical protein ISS15_05105 [Alphaproteobacteria bacterium]|nr:hypothetical protein [Alphaproteobacteria bacterium]MBL6939661.1 hypothetical protein [Alphaproteobacteria bacterium]MBL7097017.1 hypothetical protein [Alphaproteobacteria bacterium]